MVSTLLPSLSHRRISNTYPRPQLTISTQHASALMRPPNLLKHDGEAGIYYRRSETWISCNIDSNIHVKAVTSTPSFESQTPLQKEIIYYVKTDGSTRLAYAGLRESPFLSAPNLFVFFHVLFAISAETKTDSFPNLNLWSSKPEPLSEPLIIKGYG